MEFTVGKEFIVVKEFMVHKSTQNSIGEIGLSGSTEKSTPDGDDHYSQEPDPYRDTSRLKY